MTLILSMTFRRAVMNRTLGLNERGHLRGWAVRWVLVLAVMLFLGCQTQPQSPDASNSAWNVNRHWLGVHLAVQSDEQAAAVIAALPRLRNAGVNAIVAEVDYNFEFASHPEVREQHYLSRAQASALAVAARAQGVRLIPQINCLGHQSWSKTTLALLTSHPEFDETPGQYPGNEGIYCRSWCPQHPSVNRVVFDLIDELTEAFHADAFHVGMDEVFLIGSEFCPRCRKQDPGQLFAKAVNDLHQHIVKKRKLQMLMWGDRLLDSASTGYSEWEAAKNGTAKAIDLIPKDIVICDWHYEKRQDYPSVGIFSGKGFRVWPSGWQPLEASIAFSKFAASRHDPKVVGYLCTTWGKVKIPDAPEWRPLVEPLKEWKQVP